MVLCLKPVDKPAARRCIAPVVVLLFDQTKSIDTIMATIDEMFINTNQIFGLIIKGGRSPVLPGLCPPKGMTRMLGAIWFENPKAGAKRVGKYQCMPCLLQATLRLSCLFQCYMYTWAHAHSCSRNYHLHVVDDNLRRSYRRHGGVIATAAPRVNGHPRVNGRPRAS